MKALDSAAYLTVTDSFLWLSSHFAVNSNWSIKWSRVWYTRIITTDVLSGVSVWASSILGRS